MQAGVVVNLNFNNDLLGTSGEFYWYIPDWLGKWICKFTKRHEDDYEFGSWHCLRCSACLHTFDDPELNKQLCPDCEMTEQQLAIWADCELEDCMQECLNG